MMEFIAKPFGWLLLFLNNLVGNYGVAIFLFALLVKLIMLPFQFKSKKSMMRMTGLNDKVRELQKKHEGNQQKLQMEMNKLYKEEKVNPMSGCIWTLIPFPILIALYRAIREPLTIMMGVPKELLAEGGAIVSKLNELGFVSTAQSAYLQLDQSQFISAHFEEFAGISDKLVQINYKFLGLNLGDMPKLMFWTAEGFTWADVSVWLPAVGLFLIPIISALMSWLSMKLSQKLSPNAAANQEQQASQMKMMNLMMPLMSLYICFIMPAALGIYWIYQSVLGVIQEFFMNKYFGRILEKEKAEREPADRIKAAEIERRRQETERLKAEGITTANSNTSKKKIQARQKAELDEIKAAAIREEKAARRARLGIEEHEEIPASQVGNRVFARGRAYVPDRFTNPQNAAEATEKAAALSESYESPVQEAPEETAAPAAETAAAETAAPAVETAPAVDSAPEAEEETEEVFFVEEDSEEN